MSIVNPVNFKQIEKLLYNFMPFALDRMEIDESPSIRFAKDPDNAKDPLGKTGYYEPDTKMITVYVDGRHPKDIMRSISHELVHHAQNLRGDLQNSSGVGEQGYAQNDEHLREMEREAYEQGNLCFRDWEDGLKMSNTRLYEAMQASRSDLIDMIRDYSKELTGRRAEYGDLEKLANMSDEELDMYYQGMFDSPEAQFMADKFRDDEEAEMGTDDDFDRMPKQSGMGRGMRESLNLFERVSRSFGYKLNEQEEAESKDPLELLAQADTLAQELADAGEDRAAQISAILNRLHGAMSYPAWEEISKNLQESFGYKLNESDEELSSQLEQTVAHLQNKYNLSQEEALEAMAKMLSAMEKHDTERRVSDYTAQSKFREGRGSDFFDSDDEKEMMKKMSNKEFYKYVTRDRHVVPNLKGDMGEIPGMEGPFQFRSGAVLYYDPKVGKYYDRGKDMYLDNEEAAEVTMEAKHAKVNGILSSIMEDDTKMNQFLAKVTETLGLDHEEFAKLYSQRVASAKQNKGDLKQMTTEELTEFLSSKINKNIKKNNKQSDDNKKALEKDKDDEKEIKKEYMDDFDMDPHEDEEINALLAKYGLDDDSTPVPADADAEAAAERDSMGEFDAEEDEEDEPIMMKEKEPEQMELDMDTSAPAGMTVEKFADMFDLDPEQDNDGQVIFYASSEMGPKLTELIKQARDAGYDMAQNNDGSITIYTDEYPSHGEEPVRGFGITMEKKSDEDGDGDIDSDDYMAKKDKAIKKAMGKEDKEDVNEQMGEDLVAKIAELMETDPEYQHTLKPFVQKFLDVSQGPASRGPARDLEAILPEWVPGQDIHGVIKKAKAGSAPMEEAGGASVSPEEFAQEHGLDLQTDNDGQKIIYVDASQAFSLSMKETAAIIKAAGWDVQRTNDGFIIYTGEGGQAPMEESFDRFHSDRRNTMLNEALMKWCTK